MHSVCIFCFLFVSMHAYALFFGLGWGDWGQREAHAKAEKEGHALVKGTYAE